MVFAMNDNVIKMTKTRQTRLLSYMSPSNGFLTRQSSKNKSIYRSLELKQLRMGVQLISKPHKANSFSIRGLGLGAHLCLCHGQENAYKILIPRLGGLLDTL